MGTPVRIENVVICFPHLFEKHTPPGSDRSTYAAEFILTPGRNDAAIAAVKAAFEKTATEAGKGAMLPYLKSPLIPGDTVNASLMSKGKNPRKEIEGKFVLRASSYTDAPYVCDQNRAPINPTNSANIFGGCVVNAFVDLYWSNNAQNPGVFAGLSGVQLVNNVNVQRLGGTRPSADQMFDVIAPPLQEEGGVGPAPWY